MKNLKCSHGMKNKNTAKKQQFSENCRRTLQRRQTFHRIYNYKLKLKHFFLHTISQNSTAFSDPCSIYAVECVCVCVYTRTHSRSIVCMCVCVCVCVRPHTVAQSCLILCNPTDWTPPGSSVHGIVQA